MSLRVMTCATSVGHVGSLCRVVGVGSSSGGDFCRVQLAGCWPGRHDASGDFTAIAENPLISASTLALLSFYGEGP